MRKLILILLMLPLASYASELGLEDVTVHLFLEKSGKFSQDITSTKEFMSHNFRPFGKGIPEDEIFHSYLVKILFSSNVELFKKGKVATVTIINNKDSSLVHEEDILNLYVGREKLIYKSILVSGHECESQTLVVTTNENSISKTLPFHCGE